MNELIISSFILSISGFLAMIFRSVRRSRCTSVKCFCFECKREILTQEEVLVDVEMSPS